MRSYSCCGGGFGVLTKVPLVRVNVTDEARSIRKGDRLTYTRNTGFESKIRYGAFKGACTGALVKFNRKTTTKLLMTRA